MKRRLFLGLLPALSVRKNLEVFRFSPAGLLSLSHRPRSEARPAIATDYKTVIFA